MVRVPFAFVDPELAYIDPGSGSLIVQVLIATIVAIPIFFRTQIGRALSRLRRRGQPFDSNDEGPGPG